MLLDKHLGVHLKDIDIVDVSLDTDVLHSLPFKYTIHRLTASVTPGSSGATNLDTAHASKEISFDLRVSFSSQDD